MSDPVSHLKRELLAAAERQQGDAVPARKSRRRWLLRSEVQQTHRRRRLVALTAAALVVAVGTASAIGGVRDFILDRGFVGVPPEGATPSSPEKGELVVSWLGRSATLPKQVVVGFPCGRPPCAAHPLVRSWVYADGRIIWSRTGSSIPEGANELTSGYLEQRLTPEGVELVRSAVSGLFDRSRALLQTVPAPYPGVGDAGSSRLVLPRDYGSSFGSVEVPDGDRLVRLAWVDDPGDGKGGWVLTIATPEQLSALRRVDALLTDPASVLPPSAWAVREVRAYVPSHYAVCIDTSPPKDLSQLLSLLPARAAELLRGKSSTSSEGDVVDGAIGVIGRRVTYCSKLATEEAREVADALSGLDQDPRWWGLTLAYRVAGGARDWEATAIWFEPYFPHGHYTYSASG